MTFFDSRIILPPAISKASTYTSQAGGVFTASRVLGQRTIQKASSYVSNAGKVFTPSRIIPHRTILKAAAFLPSPASRPETMRVFYRSRAIRPFALPVVAGDTGRRITLILDFYQGPPVRSSILPSSTGKISHARILQHYRNLVKAEAFHAIMRDY